MTNIRSRLTEGEVYHFDDGSFRTENESDILLTLSVNSFCRCVGIKKTTAYKLIREKKVDACKIGSRTLITVESIRALIEHSRVKRGS